MWRRRSILRSVRVRLSRSGPNSVEWQLSDSQLVVWLVRSFVIVPSFLDPDTGEDMVGQTPNQENEEAVVCHLGVQSVGVQVEESVSLERGNSGPPVSGCRESSAVQLHQTLDVLRHHRLQLVSECVGSDELITGNIDCRLRLCHLDLSIFELGVELLEVNFLHLLLYKISPGLRLRGLGFGVWGLGFGVWEIGR